MDAQKLKQFLAGISIAGLLAGGITLSCDKSGKSGWGGSDKGAVGTDEKKGKSGWGGADKGAVSTDKAEKEKKGKSGWGGTK